MIAKVLNTEKKGYLVNYFAYMKLSLPVSKVNFNSKYQEDSENICSLCIEETRIFCKLKV